MPRSHNSTYYLAYRKAFGLPCTAFPRRYSRHRYCFLFLPLLRCFTSGGSHSFRSAAEAAGFPFTDPRFYGCMRLAGAYRSLPRPSSAPEPSHPPSGVASAGSLQRQILWQCHLMVSLRQFVLHISVN